MTVRYEPLTQPGPGEVLLGWLDAEGSGTLDVLEKRVTWFGSGRAGDSLAAPTKTAFFGWAREMSALGYLDISFTHRRWSAADPALFMLPGCDGLLMLAGVRSSYLVERLEEIGFDGYPIRHTPDLGAAIPVPGTLLIQAECQGLVAELFNGLRAAEPRLVNVGCAASRLALSARPIRQYLSLVAAPTDSSDTQLERLVPARLVADVSGFPDCWVPAPPGSRGRGAYRWRKPGQLVHALFDGEWRSGDRSEVIHAALSMDQAFSSLRWAAYGDGDLNRGALSVHRHIELPMLHKRSATLCTGFPARTEGGLKVYEGIPRVIAELIARSLGQKLMTDDNARRLM
jgi:hypothetical protein